MSRQQKRYLKRKDNKKKVLNVATTGLYDKITNFIALPDEWNGWRWVNYMKVFSKDFERVRNLIPSFEGMGILCAFDSVIIPKTFYAVLDGKTVKYEKGKRLLLDKNRRYKAVSVAVNDEGYTTKTECGLINHLPVCDFTDVLQKTMGEMKDLSKDGKEMLFAVLQNLNVGGIEFNDKSYVIGGAECIQEEIRLKKFKFIKEQIKIHDVKNNGKLTDKVIFKAITARESFGKKERKSLDITYDYNKFNEISLQNLTLVHNLKKKLGTQIPTQFIKQLLGLIWKWVKRKDVSRYFLSQKKIASTQYDPITGDPKTIYSVDDASRRTDCFPLPNLDNIDLYKKYLNGIENYIVGTWKKELVDVKLPAANADATREIEKRIGDAWDEYCEIR